MMNIKENPAAYAVIKGNKEHPNIKGKAAFYDTYGGTVLVVSVCGLPGEAKDNSSGFHGFHIHEGASVQEICRMNLQMHTGIIPPRDPRPRNMQVICRRYLAIMGWHGWLCIRIGFIRRMWLGGRLSYMRKRMIFVVSLREMQGK